VTSETARKRFQEIVPPYLDDVYSLARWLTGSGVDAEDVAQDACLRALAALERGRPERPRAWLMAVTRNAAFDWLARNRPRALVLAGDAVEAEAQGAIDPPGPETFEAVDRAALAAAIAALPMVFRETLVMREVNGLSYQEIAVATESPVGTVMSRLARARALLAEKLGAP
jgi:RNA polymerase sigma factor (sigma-70 family)